MKTLGQILWVFVIDDQVFVTVCCNKLEELFQGVYITIIRGC